jgi:hypothetical protein
MGEMKGYKESKRRGIHTNNKRRKTNWIGHILCRNCFLKQVVEGKIGFI